MNMFFYTPKYQTNWHLFKRNIIQVHYFKENVLDKAIFLNFSLRLKCLCHCIIKDNFISNVIFILKLSYMYVCIYTGTHTFCYSVSALNEWMLYFHYLSVCTCLSLNPFE